tara:strand:- start:49 stop:786 length:738 start_codon:yes stop_codon:yes gene_type:complete
MKYYTVQEVSKSFNVSDRAIIHRCVKAKIKKKNGSYSISEKLVSEWSESRTRRNRNAEPFFKKTIKPNRSKSEVNNILPNDVQVKNLSQHQNTALLNKVETLEQELLNYRKVLDVHSRIFKTITDKLENVTNTNKQNQNRDRVAEPILKIATKKTEQEIEEGKLKLQAQLEKQFGYGVKHISINKELPNETPMNEVGFGTRLHHLHKLEDTYPTNSISRTENNETKTTITRRNEDGKLNTTSSKS